MRKRARRFLPVLCLALCLPITGRCDTQTVVDGQPLDFWVASVSEDLNPNELKATVDALSSALSSEDGTVRVEAADALAILGPKAKPAIPALIGQLDHEVPWVRSAAAGALAAMGKEAVPDLIETFRTDTGGPRVRAAFILGAIGPDAKAFMPYIEEAVKSESDVMLDRFLGIMSQIDPEKYGQASATPEARFDVADMTTQTGPATAGKDWPQFHGPGRDSISPDNGLLKTWPEDGPPLLWTLEGFGRGYSTVSIAAGKLFTMGDLPSKDGSEQQFVMAWDLKTRKKLWSTPVGPGHKDGGSRGVPTVDGERVYAISTEGDIVCLETATGALRWRRSMATEFGGKIMTVWKYSESPLVDGDMVVCTPGGDDAVMVALDKITGETIWKCAAPELGEEGVDGAAYSSAVVAVIGGVRQYVQLVGRGVIGVDADTGRFLWKYNRIANTVANVTTPVVRGDYVFVTTAYFRGAALLKIARKEDGFEAKEVYFIPAKEFQNHHGGVVLLGDYIYAGDGFNKGNPACVEIGTGKVVWKERAPAKGSAGVVYADGHIVFRYDRGDVMLVEATPEEFRIKGRFEAPQGEGPAWPHPVIHNGLLYLRHGDILSCYNLRAGG